MVETPLYRKPTPAEAKAGFTRRAMETPFGHGVSGEPTRPTVVATARKTVTDVGTKATEALETYGKPKVGVQHEELKYYNIPAERSYTEFVHKKTGERRIITTLTHPILKTVTKTEVSPTARDILKPQPSEIVRQEIMRPILTTEQYAERMGAESENILFEEYRGYKQQESAIQREIRGTTDPNRLRILYRQLEVVRTEAKARQADISAIKRERSLFGRARFAPYRAFTDIERVEGSILEEDLPEGGKMMTIIPTTYRLFEPTTSPLKDEEPSAVKRIGYTFYATGVAGALGIVGFLPWVGKLGGKPVETVKETVSTAITFPMLTTATFVGGLAIAKGAGLTMKIPKAIEMKVFEKKLMKGGFIPLEEAPKGVKVDIGETYGGIRNIMTRKGKVIEILEPLAGKEYSGLTFKTIGTLYGKTPLKIITKKGVKTSIALGEAKGSLIQWGFKVPKRKPFDIVVVQKGIHGFVGKKYQTTVRYPIKFQITPEGLKPTKFYTEGKLAFFSKKSKRIITIEIPEKIPTITSEQVFSDAPKSLIHQFAGYMKFKKGLEKLIAKKGGEIVAQDIFVSIKRETPFKPTKAKKISSDLLDMVKLDKLREKARADIGIGEFKLLDEPTRPPSKPIETGVVETGEGLQLTAVDFNKMFKISQESLTPFEFDVSTVYPPIERRPQMVGIKPIQDYGTKAFTFIEPKLGVEPKPTLKPMLGTETTLEHKVDLFIQPKLVVTPKAKLEPIVEVIPKQRQITSQITGLRQIPISQAFPRVFFDPPFTTPIVPFGFGFGGRYREKKKRKFPLWKTKKRKRELGIFPTADLLATFGADIRFGKAKQPPLTPEVKRAFAREISTMGAFWRFPTARQLKFKKSKKKQKRLKII